MSDYKHHNVACDGSVTVSYNSNILTSTDAYTIDPKYWCISDEIYTGKPSTQEDVKKALDWYKLATEQDFNNKKGGDEDMRYLYEVILVNPKNDEYVVNYEVARSETSALMEAYKKSQFNSELEGVDFDDLKTSCRVLMEWKKEKSLKKAIETIKEAVE